MNSILVPSIHRVSSPDFINQTIIWLVSDQWLPTGGGGEVPARLVGCTSAEAVPVHPLMRLLQYTPWLHRRMPELVLRTLATPV